MLKTRFLWAGVCLLLSPAAAFSQSATCCGDLVVVDAGPTETFGGCPTAPTITTNFQFQCKDASGTVLSFPILTTVAANGTGGCHDLSPVPPNGCADPGVFWECRPTQFSMGPTSSASTGHSWTGGANDRSVDVQSSTCAGGPQCSLGGTDQSTRICPCSDCEEPEESCEEPCGGCGGGIFEEQPTCECLGYQTPILVSIRGNRLQLTSAQDGVNFDLDSDGIRERVGWTAPGADDAFLVFDRNQNGVIDNGTELFGDTSPQHPSADPNGFEALAWHDDPHHGGNGDGVIDSKDPVFYDLAFWIDSNHDGVSQASELRWAIEAGVVAFGLDYRTSRRTDQHGNQLKYLGRIEMDAGRHGPRRKFAVDVIFVRE